MTAIGLKKYKCRVITCAARRFFSSDTSAVETMDVLDGAGHAGLVTILCSGKKTTETSLLGLTGIRRALQLIHWFKLVR